MIAKVLTQNAHRPYIVSPPSHLATRRTSLLALLAAWTLCLVMQSPVVQAAPLNLPPDPMFGSATNFDGGTWSSGNMTFTADVVATNNAASTFTLNAGDVSMYGSNSGLLTSGKFENLGTFTYQAATILRIRDGASFDNRGTLNLAANNSWLYFDQGPVNTFRNLDGLINVTGSATRFENNGLFTTFDGTTLRNLNLTVASGGNFSLKANATGGQVRLGAINVANGGSWSYSTPSVLTDVGGGAINFNQAGKINLGTVNMGADIILDSAGGNDLLGGFITNNGNDLTIASGRTVNFTSAFASDSSFSGSGSIINNGTFDYQAGTIFRIRNGATFDNYGTVNLTANNSWFYFDNDPVNTFRNLDGLINVTGNNTRFENSGVFTTFDGTTLRNLNLTVASGGNFTLKASGTGGDVRLGAINVASGGSWTYSTSSLLTDVGGGAINFNQAGKINLGTVNMGADIILDSAGGNDLLGGFITNNGNNLTIASGRTVNLTSSLGSDSSFSGTGSLINNGTLNYNAGTIWRIRDGATLQNNGTFSLNHEGAWVYLGNGSGNLIENSSTGIITKNAATNFARIETNGTLDNEGTIYVPGGELRVNSSVAFPKFSAGTLTGGTYTINSTATGTALLDLQPANAGIAIIGANATVNLIGTGANIQQLGATFSGLDGKLLLSQGKQLTADMLGMGSSAELTLGLASLASTNSLLTVNGDLAADGLINIQDIGGLEIGIYDLITFTGTLTDNGIALGSITSALSSDPSLTFSLIVPTSGTVGGSIQLLIGAIPEPSSGILLMMGLIALRRRTRRKA